MSSIDGAPLAPEAFIDRLRQEGARRYHDQHPFHQRMLRGELQRREIQGWVLNRYYYQTRIPIKDALILAKSDDPAWRRRWIHRIVDHDGAREGEGGIALWLRLAEGVGLDRAEVESLRGVLPAVRFACDAYVTLVRERTLVEAVASSLTECFAPDLMSRRVAAWEVHYPWVDQATLEYFRSRVPRARDDGQEALDLVVRGATTRALQEACVGALITKCTILWAMLDAIAAGYGGPGEPAQRTGRRSASPGERSSSMATPKLARKAKLRWDGIDGRHVLLYPERGLLLNEAASAVLARCDGTRSVSSIIAEIVEGSGGAKPAEEIERDVLDFLDQIAARGLFEDRG